MAVLLTLSRIALVLLWTAIARGRPINEKADVVELLDRLSEGARMAISGGPAREKYEHLHAIHFLSAAWNAVQQRKGALAHGFSEAHH